MVHVYRIAVGLLLYVALAYGCRSGRDTQALNFSAEKVPQPTSFTDLFPAHGGSAQEREAFNSAKEARVEKLAELESSRTKREVAIQQRPERIARINRSIQHPWEQLVLTNQTRFAELKRAAAAAPTGQVDCNLCDGQSYMPCLLCQGSKECGDCLGHGELAQGKLCPVCVGTGKCSLCTGFGKMLCPFCDDGTIHAHHPSPRLTPWTDERGERR